MLINRFHTVILFTAIPVYLVAAYFSTGYYHPDEHFQIVEFADYKLGVTSAQELPWEYQANIRSAMQPALCYCFLKVLGGIGIENPYDQALVLRLLSALFSLYVVNRFVAATITMLREPWRKYYILLSCFLWFLPFLSVRFSAENWSGNFFLLALASLLKGHPSPKRSFTVAGIWMAMAFLFRYQTLLLTISMLCWLLFIKKERYRNLIVLSTAFLAVTLLGILVDAWFYEDFVIVCWKYIHMTLLAGTPPLFGIEPWYFYLTEIIHMPFFLIGGCMLLTLVVTCIKTPTSWLVWLIVPFMLIHSLIAHKELRFLFPVAKLVPLLLILGLQVIFAWPPVNRVTSFKYLITTLLVIALLVNTVALLAAAFTPAGSESKEITAYINRAFKNKCINLYLLGSIPLFIGGENFYDQDQLSIIPLKSVKELPYIERDKSLVNLLVVQTDQWTQAQNYPFHLKMEKQSMLPWVASIINFQQPTKVEPALTLFSIQ